MADASKRPAIPTEATARKIAAVVKAFRPIAENVVGRDLPYRRVGQILVWFTNQTQDGDNYRWEYAWEEIYKVSAGFDGYDTLPGGRVGGSEGDSYGPAYNRMEDINNAGLATSDPYGNGVTQDNIDTTGLELQPIPLNVPVICDIVFPGDGSPPELAFSLPNGLDGPCDPP